ncbi:MAG: L,D-transpeptidase family protein [Candidatus Velamenicoccus archaeovorus]
MRGRPAAGVLGLVLTASLWALPVTAGAQTSTAVTLEASAASIAYGAAVTFGGSVDPAAAAQAVRLLGADGAVIAETTTDAAGAFSVRIVPETSLTVRASSGGAFSEAVTVRVHAVLSVRLGAVRLFDRAAVAGSVTPAPDGTSVTLTLVLSGHPVADREVGVRADGTFRTTLAVRQPGTYRVRAASSPPGLARGTDADGPRTTTLPSLRVGSRGPAVLALERRLVALHYRLVGIDRTYDARTGDAVIAFRKVQGLARTTTVDATTWRRLADPRIPEPRSKARAFHIEVDQTRQVLYTVEDRVVTDVIHVSTGANGATHDGSFQVYRKLAGFSPNRLYYPSYFDGLRAIHGWTEVPTYPASHGCVRVPYWDARWIYGLAAIGTPVLIYH